MSVNAVSPSSSTVQPLRLATPDRDPGGSVSLLIDADQALVVMHGDIGVELHQDIRDLVDDLEAGIAQGLPIVVLAQNVTDVDLRAVWLLLELRRAAGSHGLRVDTPSPALRDALSMHGLARLLDTA